MTYHNEEMIQIKKQFQKSQKLLAAIGDETRQYLLLMMLDEDCHGSRVVDIAKTTHLSRPAISHHMQILKSAGIIKSRKEGTKVFYYLDPDDSQMVQLIELLTQVKDIMKKMPDRSEK